MAKRKPNPSLEGQLDMFGAMGASMSPPVAEPNAQTVFSPSPQPANDLQEVAAATQKIEPVLLDIPPTAMADVDQLDVDPDSDIQMPQRPPRPTAKIASSTGWIDDEWWTLAMVCAYLKLGRKAVWERKRDPKLAFPQPVCLGSSRPRWRGEEVKTWAGTQG